MKRRPKNVKKPGEAKRGRPKKNVDLLRGSVCYYEPPGSYYLYMDGIGFCPLTETRINEFLHITHLKMKYRKDVENSRHILSRKRKKIALPDIIDVAKFLQKVNGMPQKDIETIFEEKSFGLSAFFEEEEETDYYDE
jgi:hypothetical protein